jgi:Pyruvate/2-oxoacid:ferredoxin oxidoreductase delta subunit
VIIVLTWHLGALVFRDFDPFLAFFHLGKGITELPWGYAVLGVVLTGSLFIERFFCKYACPLGAVLGILGKLGLTKVHRDAGECKRCNLCQKKCHAHIDFLATTTIRDAECNHCMDCVVDCPKPNVLTLRGPKWRFSHPVYAAALVAGLLLFIGASKMAGKWQTRPSVVSFTDAAGRPSAGNIRGWMTLQEIAAGYGVPIEQLYREAGIPASVPPSARLNTISSEYDLDFSPEKVRDVVDSVVTGNRAPTEPTARGESEPAKSVTRGTSEHPKGSTAAAAQTNAQPAGDEPEVKGFMTLNEIALKTGVPKEYILNALGVGTEIDGRAPIRDWMHAQGKSIQNVRDAVEQYRGKNP